MKTVLAQPGHTGVKLDAVVYGDDQTDKSYREAQGLFKSYPNLKVIVAPTTVGVAAAAKAVQDEHKVGQIYVTGLGLPSEMAGHVHSGWCRNARPSSRARRRSWWTPRARPAWPRSP